jgi:hypothetical protein
MLNILPNYKFFCPNPTRYDYFLYYKKQTEEGNWSEWNRIIIGKRNLFTCFIWNPAKRQRKVFYKSVKFIKKNAGRRNYVRNNFIYFMLIDFIAQHCKSAKALQFKITYTQSLNRQFEEKILYQSKDEFKFI